MSNLDYSKPRQTYKELFGVDMPKEVEAVVSKLCLLWNVRPDNMEITHFLITGWLNAKMKEIPAATVAATKQTGDAITAALTKAGNDLLKTICDAAVEGVQNRAGHLQNEFTATATAEIKRVATEAKNLAPSQYRIIANAVLGASILAALVVGFFGGKYKAKSDMMDDLRNNPAGYKEFSSDVRVNGQAMAGFKLIGENRISFYPKKDTPKEAAEAVKAPKLPDK